MIVSQIEGVVIREAVQHHDARGWLTELFRADELPAEVMPAMGYVSVTKAGASRGPHEHRSQTDLFYFGPETNFRLYLWDNRSDTATFGLHERLELKSSRGLLVLVPPGVVHAYRNFGPADGMVMNFPNRLYAGPDRAEPVDEIRHEDDPDTPFVLDDRIG